MNIKRYIVIVVAAMMAVGVWAQNATSSPSSRLGYGDLNLNTPGAYRGMGGLGIGAFEQGDQLCSTCFVHGMRFDDVYV